MRFREIALFAAVGATALVLSSFATAEETKVSISQRVIAFDDAGARFNVEHDAAAGTMTFRLADDSKVRITEVPTVTLQTDDGPRDVTLVAVDGESNAWRLSDDALRSEKIDGSLKIVVDGRSHTTSLVSIETATEAEVAKAEEITPKAENGVTPTAKVDAPVARPAPVAPLPGEVSPATVGANRPAYAPGMNGSANGGCPHARAAALRAASGAPAAPPAPVLPAAPVAAPAPRGEIVVFDGGPRFEVVRDARTNVYTFTQLDTTIDGRPVVIQEAPTVVIGERTHTLVRVENDPRSWQLVGVDAGATAPGDARMRLSLLGRSLESRVGLSGIGVSAR